MCRRQLTKDIALLHPLIAVKKIVRPISPLPRTPPLSLPKLSLKHGRNLALLFLLKLTHVMSTLCCALLLAPLLPSRLSPISQTAPLQKSRHLLMQAISNLTSLILLLTLYEAEIRAILMSFVCPNVPTSHTLLFAPRSPQLNTVQRWRVSPRPLLRDRTLLPIQCLSTFLLQVCNFFFTPLTSPDLLTPSPPSGNRPPSFPFTKKENLRTLLLFSDPSHLPLASPNSSNV